MKRVFPVLLMLIALSLALPQNGLAHKVNIFAYVDGDSVVTDSGYSRSRRVHDGIVEVHDAATDNLLLSGNTDNEGRFTFAIPAQAREGRMDLRLLLRAGAGHQAEWVVKYAEYGDSPADASGGNASVAAPTVGGDAEVQAASTELEALVARAVHREMEPVKHMLAEMNQSGPGVSEIVGGIGWIMGLFGILAYARSRRN
ncbi:hypothetical protein [Pseudodesulfovibrio tunisiensis]|uniref:hypothetical protein n=1 Tax=Pseudodesulfovibrio tunisiensis TaxID=463192 RepID=UPI001FB44897|nr:hypothetical protein [Pseudodesulfovibrio tunisiensis]